MTMKKSHHVTGKFRGIAHQSWNINLQLTRKVPVIFHNLRGYNSHLFFRELNKFDVKIDVIPKGVTKYMEIFLDKNLVFIDSIKFMNSSLEKLLKNDFKYLTEEFGCKNLELLKQKDSYPYEYMNSFKRFSEEKECFYSSVKDGVSDDNGKKLDGHISNEEYLACKKIWEKFDMKNMGDYRDHYLKDVLLLADAFEKFIDTRLRFYGLDPCHYFSSPGLSWDAMLKMTGEKLEKFQTLICTYLLKKG